MKRFFSNGKLDTDKRVECVMSDTEYHYIRPKIEATETFQISLGEEKSTKPRASLTEGEYGQVKPMLTS